MLSLSICKNRGPSPSPSNLVSRVLIYTCIHHYSAEGARAPTARRHATGTGCGRGQACAHGAQLTWTPGEPSIARLLCQVVFIQCWRMRATHTQVIGIVAHKLRGVADDHYVIAGTCSALACSSGRWTPDGVGQPWTWITVDNRGHHTIVNGAHCTTVGVENRGHGLPWTWTTVENRGECVFPLG